MPPRTWITSCLFAVMLGLFAPHMAWAQSPNPVEPPKPVVVEETGRESAIFIPGTAQADVSAVLTNTAFSFYVYPDTKLSLTYNEGRQFYGGNASGLFLWVDNQVYGPSSIPAGRSHLPYTVITNTVTGDGSIAAPWYVTTTVGAGSTGVRLQSVLRYLNGSDTIDLLTTVSNTSANQHAISLFHAGDLYLEFPNNQSDFGYGTYRAASQGVGATTSTGDYAFLFEPLSPPATAYMEAGYSTIWSAIGSTSPGAGFNNTFRTDYHDAGAGLQWSFTLAANESRGFLHRMRLERVNLRAFEPAVDAPNIKNWGEATPLSRRRFVETFGGGMCPATGECTLDPAAENWYSRNFAQAGQGGHCYGMSVMSALFYRGIYAAGSYSVGATVPFSLTRPNTALEEQISVFHTFQSDRTISSSLEGRRIALTPNSALAEISSTLRINNLNPLILAIYGQYQTSSTNMWGFPTWQWVDGGHALVPYRIEDRGNSVFHVYVYDSNHEGDAGRFIEFNTSNNTWQYPMGAGLRPRGSFGAAGNWAGDGASKNITYVAMSAHTGQKPRLPYTAPAGEGAWLAADANWQSNLLITDDQGNQLGIVEGSLVNEIPGAVPVISLNSVQPSAPSYYVPQGNYQVTLRPLVTTTVQSQLSYMGPGFAFVADGIDLGASSQDTITLSGQAPIVTYMSTDAPKDINVSFVYSLTQGNVAGRTVRLQGVDVGAGNSITTALESSRNVVSLQGTGTTTSSYDVQIVTQDNTVTGTTTAFSYPGIVVAPGATHQLNLATLDTSGTVSLTVLDSTGAVIDDETLANSHMVEIFTDGNGLGLVSSNPAGIECGAGCTARFAAANPVTLTAAAAVGSSFAGWSGACTGVDPVCQLAVDATKSVTATFTLNSYAVTVAKVGSGSGTVTASQGGVNCGDACSGSYLYGDQVTLTAAAAAGSSFAGWNGACTGVDPVCQLAVDATKSVTATFTSKDGVYLPLITR